MSRPIKSVPLVKKIAAAFKAVGKLPRAGHNTARGYDYTRAPDVLEAVRLELFNRDVLILPNEGTPEYVPIGPSNGGEQITECRLPVTYTFKDDKEELPAIVINGIGRDVEDKALYKAQTGAQKALLKRFGLMAEEIEDPEWDGEHQDANAGETAYLPSSQQPVTAKQRHAFAEACAASGKTEQEILTYLFQEQGVSNIGDLKRGKPFTRAIQWASTPRAALCEISHKESLSPKPQAAPAFQASLPLPKPAPSFEMRVGGKTQTVEPKTGSYAL